MTHAPGKFGPAARRRFLEHLRETGHLGQSATAATFGSHRCSDRAVVNAGYTEDA